MESSNWFDFNLLLYSYLTYKRFKFNSHSLIVSKIPHPQFSFDVGLSRGVSGHPWSTQDENRKQRVRHGRRSLVDESVRDVRISQFDLVSSTRMWYSDVVCYRVHEYLSTVINSELSGLRLGDIVNRLSYLWPRRP